MEKYFDLAKLPELMTQVIVAFPVTLKMVFWSLLIGLIFGVLIAAATLSKYKVLNLIGRFYIAFMRGMPTLVLIFILYFVGPIYLKQLGIDTNSIGKDPFVIATLSLTAAANLSEMMRSAFLSVDKFQWEAAYSVGMDGFTAFRRIIFPQAFGVAIPNLGNNIINIFKNTSLAFSIGAVDLVGRAKLVSSNLYGLGRAELYLGTALIFWIVCFLLEKVTKWSEKAYSKGRKVEVS